MIVSIYLNILRNNELLGDSLDAAKTKKLSVGHRETGAAERKHQRIETEEE